MKNTKMLFAVAGVVIGMSIMFVFTGNEENYFQELERERREKNSRFRTSETSPIPAIEKNTFVGLSYYKINENYKVIASLERFEDGGEIIIPTSDGKKRTYSKYGKASFNLRGEALSLTLYLHVGKGEELLFLPFADETSAEETYGAGRYLDLEIPNDDEITLDFNLAYNPYCAYNNTYSCPLPPRENYLAVKVEAGEKNYVKN